MKSDRNGIEGKLLAAEGRIEEVVAVKEDKIEKKQNGDGEIGTSGFQTAAVIRLCLPRLARNQSERERDCNPAATEGDACVSVISHDLWGIFPLRRQKWPRDLSHCNRLMH